MKQRLFLLVSILIVASVILTACGGGAPPVATESPATEPPATEPPVTEPPASEEVPTLTIWIDSLFAEVTQQIGDEFAEEYGVNVVVQPAPFGDMFTQMLTAAPAGEGPDIIEAPHDWVGTAVAGGVVAPIDLGDKLDDFVPASISAFTYNGQLWGVPHVTESIGLFRNTDIMADAPATWDELKAMCDAVEIEYCLLLQQGDVYHFFPVVTSFGGYLFGIDDLGNYTPEDVGIDSPGSLAAAEWLDQMVKSGYVAGGIDFDTAKSLFSEGKAAFYITGPWNLATFKQAGVHYAISTIPAGTEAAKPFMGSRGMMVNSFSPQLELAMAFLTEYWATPEANLLFAQVSGKTPTIVSVLETYEDPDVAALGEASKLAQPMPAIPAMGSVWGAWGDALTTIFQQQAGPEEAFRTAAEQVRTAIEESK